MIGVDVLSDQRDLADARSCQILHLRHDRCDRPRGFGAARIGHNAERTKLVTAFLDGDKGRDAAGVNCRSRSRRKVNKFVLDGELGIYHLGAACGLRQQRRKPVVALRPDHHINHWGAAHDLLAFSLGHAACHRDNEVTAGPRCLALELTDAAKFRINLFGSLFADMTGVEDDEIGVLESARFHI